MTELPRRERATKPFPYPHDAVAASPQAGILTGEPSPGERCYDFARGDSDTGTVGERAVRAFRRPREADAVASRFGCRIGETGILHHWTLFAADRDEPHGRLTTGPEAATPNWAKRPSPAGNMGAVISCRRRKSVAVARDRRVGRQL